jgi:hypothetical protein
MKEFTYDEIVAKADSVKAVMGDGATVYLREGSMPYNKACSFEAGCSYRLGVAVSGYFTAVVKGIHCKWSFDLESYSASGSGELQPRTEAIREVLSQLEGKAKSQFREWLAGVSEKMRADAAERRGYADKLAAKAAVIADLSSEAA